MLQKIKTGSNFLFRWQAPEPVDPASTPTLTVQRAGAAIAGIPALQVVAGPATIIAIDAGSGLKILTASEAVDPSNQAAGEGWGEAFYVSPADGVIPVRVASVSGTTIKLASGFDTRVATGGVLQWATYWTTFSADDVTSEESRRLTWSVEYEPIHAGSAEDEVTTRTDSEQLIVVDRPFNVALTTARLVGRYPELRATLDVGSNSRSEVIDEALEWMILDLRAELRPRGRWEDDLDGRAFQLPLATLAAAIAVEHKDVERAGKLLKRYEKQLDTALKAAWLDSDGDGVPDEGEDGRRLAGLPSVQRTTLSDLQSGPSANRPRYYRNMKW